jgi:hypothetical protein
MILAEIVSDAKYPRRHLGGIPQMVQILLDSDKRLLYQIVCDRVVLD